VYPTNWLFRHFSVGVGVGLGLGLGLGEAVSFVMLFFQCGRGAFLFILGWTMFFLMYVDFFSFILILDK
jgi:hypothetical protein